MPVRQSHSEVCAHQPPGGVCPSTSADPCTSIARTSESINRPVACVRQPAPIPVRQSLANVCPSTARWRAPVNLPAIPVRRAHPRGVSSTSGPSLYRQSHTEVSNDPIARRVSRQTSGRSLYVNCTPGVCVNHPLRVSVNLRRSLYVNRPPGVSAYCKPVCVGQRPTELCRPNRPQRRGRSRTAGERWWRRV